jgi:TrkA family protein/sodium/hydrogen exchanger family protein
VPHYTPLITTIVAALTLAWVFAAIAHRLKLPPLVGYLLAGIVIGPFTPGYVADQNLASQLAEIGVILLMFGVGLHFSLVDLLSVRKIAIPGAITQIVCATRRHHLDPAQSVPVCRARPGAGAAGDARGRGAAGGRRDRNARADPSDQAHVVLVGHGRVGSVISRVLAERNVRLFIIEDDEDTVAALNKRGIEALNGNAADPEMIEAANLRAARCLLVAIPEAFEGGQVVQQARAINPSLSSSPGRIRRPRSCI